MLSQYLKKLWNTNQHSDKLFETKHGGGILRANIQTGDTLKKAIKAEILAREFYLAVSKKVKNPLVRRRLLTLADDELEHRTVLSRLYWAQTGTEVGDIEFEAGEFEMPDIDGMSMTEVITFAMEKEKEAVKNYTRMAEEEDDARSKSFLEYLVDFEQGHYDLLEAELAKIKGTPGWEDQEV